MQYDDLLKNRRAIRDFTDKQVPLDVVKEILQETTLTPTASNGQPCRFIIIQDRELMKRLSDESKRNLLADMDRNPDSHHSMYRDILKEETFNVFYNAPTLVLLAGLKGVESLDVDLALTAAYLMFSATERGLGTCWINLGAHIRSPQLLAEIAMPEDCRIVAPIIVGYPTSIPAASERHAPEILKVI
jgi:nitroreductase